MPVYNVQIPFTGYVNVTIRANSKKEAIDRGFEYADMTNPDQIGEVEFANYVTKGNFANVVLNDACATECSEEWADNDEDDARAAKEQG